MASTKGNENAFEFLAKLAGYISGAIWLLSIFPLIKQKTTISAMLFLMAISAIILYGIVFIISGTLWCIGWLCWKGYRFLKKYFAGAM